jgi:hypothetical protein
MAKTRHRVNRDEVEREAEAPAHRTRRQFKQLLQVVSLDDELIEDEDELVERRERIRRSRKLS